MQATEAPPLSSKAQVIVQVIRAIVDVQDAVMTPGCKDTKRERLMQHMYDQYGYLSRLTGLQLERLSALFNCDSDSVANYLDRRFGIQRGVHIPL